METKFWGQYMKEHENENERERPLNKQSCVLLNKKNVFQILKRKTKRNIRTCFDCLFQVKTEIFK